MEIKAEGRFPIGGGDEDGVSVRSGAINGSRPTFECNAFQRTQLCMTILWLESVACPLWVCG